MSTKIRDIGSDFSGNQSANKSSSTGVSASRLAHLEDLINVLSKNAQKGLLGDSEQKVAYSSLIEMLEELYGKGDAKKLLSKIDNLASGYKSGKGASLQTILQDILPIMRDYGVKHPDDHQGMIKAFAPLVNMGGGEQVIRSLIKAHSDAVELSKGLVSKDGPEALSQISSVAEILSGVSPQAADQSIDLLRPKLNALYRKNPLVMESFLKQLIPIIQMDSLKGNKDISKALLQDSTLEKLYNLPLGDRNMVLNYIATAMKDLSSKNPPKLEDIISSISGALGQKSPLKKELKNLLKGYADDSKKEDNPNYNHLLGLSMLYLLQFQQAIMSAQQDQDKLQLLISSAMMHAAEVSQQQIEKKAKEAEEAEKKAHQRPWWQIFIAIAVAVAGAVLAFFTMGLGAALVAGMVGVFMASPLFGDLTQAISKAVAKGLHDKFYNQEYKKEYNADYKKYIKQGMDPQDAKDQAKVDAAQGAEDFATQKANSVGGIIAKIIVFVAVVALSFGIGGITAGAEDLSMNLAEGAEGLADGGVESLAESGEEELQDVLDEGINENLESSSQNNYSVKWSSKGTGAFAASQGANTLVSSNIWMDVLTVNPTWAKKHKELVVVLDVILQVVTAAMGMYGGFKAFQAKSSMGLLNGLSKFVNKGGYLLGASLFMQAGAQGVSTVMGGIQAHYLAKLAEYNRELGHLESELQILTESASMMQDTMSINDKSASLINKSVSDSINQCEELSGVVWKTAESILS